MKAKTFSVLSILLRFATKKGLAGATSGYIYWREGGALLKMENVLLSPHMAGYCDAVAREISDKSVGEANRVLTGR